MAEDRHFRWRGAREECAPEWFGAWPLLPFRMFLSEKLVARRRQIQVLAQGTPRIFGTEETATLQFGNDQINEILEPFGRYRRSDHQAVASPRHVPILHLFGDLGSTALHGRTAGEIGIASCRERECQSVSISVRAVPCKKNKK